ncbi:hypothetical protein AwDysgo_09160 [Bacteroidales bacterium]|nr:hypothetical protein AwDysgo_09160 [Bacteroidales bacterium]
MQKRFIFIILLFSFIFAKAQKKHEIRAVWLTTNYALDWPSRPFDSPAGIARQKNELEQILDKLEAENYNMVFIQTRLRGDVIYHSAIEPMATVLRKGEQNFGDYDPLAFAIEACHLRGLECHAWFVTYPLGTIGKNGRVAKQLMKKKNMVKIHEGEYYLDPGEPATSTYLLGLIKEIVRNYDIDGFHFDYLRYPEKAKSFPDQSTFKKFGADKKLNSWRRDNINKFVYSAYDTIKYIKPWVQVSSSVLGKYQYIPASPKAGWTAYEEVHQDPVDWLRKGKHDFIVPMMYYTDDLFFPFIHNWIDQSHGRFVVPGIGLYRLDLNEGNWESKVIMDQIAYSRENNTQGNAFYRAKYLADNFKGIQDKIFSQFYEHKSLLPALTWLDNIAPAALQEISAIAQDSVLRLSWENADLEEVLYYNVYRSQKYPVDIGDPANIIFTGIRATEIYCRIDLRQEIGFHYVVTSNDRYHNESSVSRNVYFCTGDFEK